MTLGTYLRILRKRWLTVLGCMFIGVLAAGLITFLMPKTYSASATDFVSITSSGTQPDSLYQNSQFALTRVASYTDMVHSPAVLRPVIDELDLSMSVRELDEQVTAINPADTVLIKVTASSGNPRTAKSIADAVAAALGERIEAIEEPRSGTVSPVKVSRSVPATLPDAPVSPQPILNVALGLLLGLALGAAVAVLREQLDTTVKSGQDLQEITGQTPLGVIGFDNAFKEFPLVASRPTATSLEDFRSVRTSLQFVNVDGPPRHIVVSSAMAGEGKSVTACNLAVIMAQGGQSVCLVEADLRRPRAMSYFGVDGSVGLTNVVAGHYDLDEVLVPWNRGMVTLLPAGPLPPDPGQLLGSAASRAVFAELRNRFDVVIVDAPPLLPVSDAAVLSQAADGVILVVRHGHVRKEQVSLVVDALRAVNARLIGTIRTQVPEKVRQASLGRDFGYGYHSDAATDATFDGTIRLDDVRNAPSTQVSRRRAR